MIFATVATGMPSFEWISLDLYLYTFKGFLCHIVLLYGIFAGCNFFYRLLPNL